MSSNMYGFTCEFVWQGRNGVALIAYEGTCKDDPKTLNRVTADWESADPGDLARYELQHRDWSLEPYAQKEVRICVFWLKMSWLEKDPCEPLWKPPAPTEKEMFELIASGRVTNIQHGWDT